MTKTEITKQMAKLRSEGEKLYYIAQKFGVSVPTVRNYLIELGVYQSNYGTKTKAIVEALKKNPHQTQGSLAREFGCSQQIVSYAINKYCNERRK